VLKTNMHWHGNSAGRLWRLIDASIKKLRLGQQMSLSDRWWTIIGIKPEQKNPVSSSSSTEEPLCNVWSCSFCHPNRNTRGWGS
jgi:hypothetical protein